MKLTWNAGLAMQNGIDVFRDLLVERVVGALEHGARSAIHADCDTLPAADTLRVVDDGLVVSVPSDRDLRARKDAGTASGALDNVDTRLGFRMHLHLATPRTTAHAEIFERAAEAGLLMPLEVRERDDDVGIGNCSTDLGCFTALEMNGNLAVIRALEAVGNDNVCPDGDTVEAVLLGGLQVIDRIGTASRIQRITVRKKGPATKFADQLDDPRHIVGANIGEIARLSQVQLERNELVLEVDALDAGCPHQRLGLVQKIVTRTRTQVREPHLRRVHACSIAACSHRSPIVRLIQ